jgi:hypothetical protein
MTLWQDQFYPATVEQIPLHFKVTDVNGNSATETATVTVEDKIAPVVVTKTLPFSSHQCSRYCFDSCRGCKQWLNRCLRNCDYDFRQDQFYLCYCWANTVTLKVTDVNGNSATETATVTVEDKTFSTY